MKFTLKGKSYCLAFGLLIILSSCSTKRYKNALFTSPTDVVTDTLKTVYVVNNQGVEDRFYKIKPNDQIAIKNLQNPEFGIQGAIAGSAPSSFLVDLDGYVNLPVIGRVAIAGLTRREATTKLQELYSKSLLKDPIIELNVINLKVTLLGEFKSPGNFVLEKDNTTLIDMLGIAGGLSEKAEPKNVKIIRGNRANPEVIYVNLKNINSLGHPKLVLQNNDLIYAEPRKAYADAEGLQSVMTNLQPVILLLSSVVLIYNITRR